MKIKIALTLLALLCACACKKKVEDANKNLEGYWQCLDLDPYYYPILTITGTYGDYEENSEAGESASLKGTARANSNKLKIGDIFHFNIIDPPHLIDTSTIAIYVWPNENSYLFKKANWMMKLSEVKPAFYLKVSSFTFYKADY